MQIPVLSGIESDENSELRSRYPRNMVPVPKQNGVSEGYLRPADGIVELATGPGIDRGAINWKGICYRVMGSKLISLSESYSVTVIGDVGNGGQVTFDYSFDRLAIASNQRLYYWDGTTLSAVSDPDLGVVIDFIWVDGYFMTTDGTNLVVTELNDPFSVNPLKYGSSEADPDPIKAIKKLHNEPYALNRYTTEAFQNIGGENFPFQRIEGAQIQRGTIGTHTCCVYLEALAFLGGGRNEAPAIWLGANGNSTKISTREIDILLQAYTETELSTALMEVRVEKTHQTLYLHLLNETVAYDAIASQAVGEPVWHVLTTSMVGNEQYAARNLVWCYDRFIVGHASLAKIGYLTLSLASHWGVEVGWDFDTVILYNASKGAIVYQLELVCLNGRAAIGVDSTVWTCYSLDGEVWSVERAVIAGRSGNRNRRIAWFNQGMLRNWRIQRFRGTSETMLSVLRLEAELEGLAA